VSITPTSLKSSATRRRAHRRVAALADRVLEATGLPVLSQILTRDLPAALGLQQATLLLWDRKLESFHALQPGDVQGRVVHPGEGVPAPEARFLLADGALIETAGQGDGVLLPLMARSGLVGMLVLGAPRRARKTPLAAADLQPLSALASRSALAIENHLYQAELIASERMAALGTMAGTLAHDFRGPMTVIRGYAELLRDPTVTPAEVLAHATLIVNAVERLERMTAETLDFAREGGRLVRRTVVLPTFLEEMAAEMEREFPGLLVRRAFTVDEVSASLDADKLMRAVGNIAANARDAMGGRGVLHMEARVEVAPPPLLTLVLADEGPGVPPEIREQVFDPFVTRGKKRGTGLGLAVARRFVEDHGGRIELLEEGPGARFRIRLPLQDPAGSV
jgi:signal transduction histidine kinase